MQQRYAVALTAATPSELPSWAGADADRNWALLVLTTGRDGDIWRGHADFVRPLTPEQSPWHAICNLLRDDDPDLRGIEYFWVPDAAVVVPSGQPGSFFDLVSALRMPLAQPALRWDSPAPSVWSCRNANFAVRFGDAVDLRLACLSRELLQAHGERLATRPNLPAGTLDFTLAAARSNLLRPCAVIDAAAVTLPTGAAAPPEDERLPICYGALAPDGASYSLFDSTAAPLIERLASGLRPDLKGTPEAVRWLAAQQSVRARLADAAATEAPAAPAAGPTPQRAPAAPARRGPNRPSLSLVVADTDTYVLANRAVRECLDRFDFDRVLIFSDQPAAWPGLDVIRIAPIASIGAYSELIVNRVVEHLETDFFLVAQFDGFILNAPEFSPHFFHYDYIGAPWPWYPHCSVGNGGFSWRSRRLAEAGARLGYRPDQDPVEDEFLCRRHRIRLEAESGCQFAPTQIAEHFSFESGSRRFPTFGFHGVFHLPQVYRNQIDFLIDNLTPRVLRNDLQYAHIANGIAAISPSRLAPLQRRRDGALQACVVA